MRYSEDEIAAEEERIGAKLPDGDLAVVRKDGSLAWWRHDAGEDEEELVAVEVDWQG